MTIRKDKKQRKDKVDTQKGKKNEEFPNFWLYWIHSLYINLEGDFWNLLANWNIFILNLLM